MANSNKMKAIWICDDNPIHLSKIKNFVETYMAMAEDWNICAVEPHCLMSAVEEGKERIDILVVDIELGVNGLDGIGISEKVNRTYPGCRIIYISSYAEYATRVYETDHMYFVLKNEMEEFLPKAINKAMATKNAGLPALWVKGDNGKQLVLLEDIFYFEKEKGGHKILVVTERARFEMVDTLKGLEKNWPELLVRCHYSFLINADYIKAWNREYFELKTGETIQIGRRFQKLAKDAYLRYLQRITSKNDS